METRRKERDQLEPSPAEDTEKAQDQVTGDEHEGGSENEKEEEDANERSSDKTEEEARKPRGRGGGRGRGRKPQKRAPEQPTPRKRSRSSSRSDSAFVDAAVPTCCLQEESDERLPAVLWAIGADALLSRPRFTRA